jgi:hypothetical protein
MLGNLAFQDKAYVSVDKVGIGSTFVDSGTSGQILQVYGGGAYVSGSVGIGTTNPTQELDISGDIRIRGGIYDKNNNSGTNTFVPVSDGIGGWSWQPVTSAGAGVLSGITIREEGSIVGTAGSIVSIDFVGSGVTAVAAGSGVTVTFSQQVGPQGVQGFQGVQGLQGNQGNQGNQGLQGVQGLQGNQGVQGVQGFQGNQGVQGLQGHQGTQGLQGNQGLQGVQGLQGNQGNQGVQGLQGLQGNQGNQGLQGNQGVQGLQGNQGVQGLQGNQGNQGVQGLQGNQGNQGVQGLQGNQGNQGVQGLQGRQGTQGLQGNQGNQGLQGNQGVQGLQGNQGVQGLQGNQGNQGVQGLQGTQGLQGNQGNQGVQGLQGNQGNQGVQGLQGNQGVQGLQGNQGNQGVQGLQGNQGNQGVQGLQGNQGNQGVQGLQGRQGTQGLQGNQGVQGLQGLQGTQGLQGNQGVQGLQGRQGTQGLQGNQGNQGVQGLQGNQGNQGVQGLQGLQGNQGVQGLQGNQGNQGVQGFQGNQGVQGLQGRQGTQGLQGNQGNQGVQGLQGNQGNQGVQGIQGTQGLQGTQGIPGPVAGTTGQLIYNNAGIASGTEYVYYDGINEALTFTDPTSVNKRRLQFNFNDNTAPIIFGNNDFSDSYLEINAFTYDNSVLSNSLSVGGVYSVGITSDVSDSNLLNIPFYSVVGFATNIPKTFINLDPTESPALNISSYNDFNVRGTSYFSDSVGIGTKINIIPYDTLNSGTLSFEGSAGQLFSITNNLTSGSIFSVNDVSGIPSIDVNADGTVSMVSYGGSLGIGTTNPQYKLDVIGNLRVTGVITAPGGINAPLYVDESEDDNVFYNIPFLDAIGGGDAYRLMQVDNAGLRFNPGVNVFSVLNIQTPGGLLSLGSASGKYGIGIVDNGDVGIGTTSPTQKLDVFGSARIRGALYDSNNSSGISNYILTSTETGISWTTPAALQGAQGVQGVQGVQGLQGRQGVQGVQGFQGRQGVQGLQGLQGNQGVQGLQGNQGVQGLQGNQGVQGLQGNQGSIGSQGILGETQIYASSSPPPSPFEGDLWLDTDTGITYTYWNDGTSSQWFEFGPDPIGPIGPAGPTGNQGLQGVQGRIGNSGAQGTVGPTASVPDQSVVLTDISSSFNGSTTQFTISDGSGNFINTEIDSEARLLISVGGIIQQPDPTQNNGFYITGGTNRTTDPIKVNFVEAPKSGQLFFGVAIKTTNSPSLNTYATQDDSIAYSIIFGV